MKRIFASVLLCAMLFTTLALGGVNTVANPGTLDADAYPQMDAVIEDVSTSATAKPTLSEDCVVETKYEIDHSWYDSEEAKAAAAENGYYTISTPAHLRSFFAKRQANKSLSFEGEVIRLTADLKMIDTQNVGTLGTDYTFKGTFDGGIYDEAGNLTGRHVISGLYLWAENGGQRGLFGHVGGNAVMKNVAFIDCSVVNYSVSSGKENVGGLFSKVTAANDDVTIQNVYNDIDVTSITATIKTTARDGSATEYDVTSVTAVTNCIGGFVATVSGGTLTIEDCVYAGEINAAASRVGGFVGYCTGTSSTVNIENSEFAGTLTPITTIWAGGKNSDHDAPRTESSKTYYPAEFDVSSFIRGWNSTIGYVNTATGKEGTANITNVNDGGYVRTILGVDSEIESSPTVDKSWYDSTAEAGTVFVIDSAAELRGFFKLRAEKGNSFEGHVVKLTKDIQLSNTALYTINGSDANYYFKGTFDGNGHFISNAKHNRTNSGVAGLFGVATGSATVKNLSVLNSAVTCYSVFADKSDNGGIFSKVVSGTDVKIENVYCDIDVSVITVTPEFTTDGNTKTATGNITGTGGSVGGFAGSVQNSKITITNSVYAGDLKAYAAGVGGFIGQISGNSTVTISNSKNVGSLQPLTKFFVGGAYHNKAGNHTSGTTTYVSTTAAVTAPNTYLTKWGGFIGNNNANAGYTVTLTNCVNNVALIKSAENLFPASEIGGMIGSSASKGTTQIEQCVNQADITASGSYIGGMIGNASPGPAYATVTILNSKNTGAIKGLGTLGGAVGQVQVDSIEINNFINSGNISRTTEKAGNTGSWIGGIGGYIKGTNTNLIDTVRITNCKNTGTITGNRCTGGLVGYVQYTADLMVANCYSMGNIDARVTDTGNLGIGGLLGYIAETGTANVSGNTFGGNLTVNTNIKSTAAVEVCVGGLVGIIRRNATSVTVDEATISLYVHEGCDEKYDEFLFNNNTINLNGIQTGTLNWNLDQSTSTKTYVEGTVTRDAYCAALGSENANGTNVVRPEFKMNYFVSENKALPEGMTCMVPTNDARLATFTQRMIMKIGAQYAVNAGADGEKGTADDTYNLRYVFAIDGLQDADKAIGFVVTRYYFETGASAPDSATKTLYCPNVYKVLKGENETYNAEDYGADYFFTLELKGVPSGEVELVNGRYMLKDIDLRIYPFVNNEELKDNKYGNASGYITHSDSIAWENRINYYQSDFINNTNKLPEAFQDAIANDDGLIPDVRWHNTVLDGVEAGTKTKYECVNATEKSDTKVALTDACKGEHEGSCLPFEATGVFAELATYSTTTVGVNARYHYYPDTDVSGNRQTAYFRVAIDTTERGGAGLYDFCFQLRLGNNQLHAVRIQVNDQKYHEQTILTYDAALYQNACVSTTGTDETFQETYLTGFSAELEDGVNYVTFRMLYVHSSFDFNTWQIRNIFVAKAAE